LPVFTGLLTKSLQSVSSAGYSQRSLRFQPSDFSLKKDQLMPASLINAVVDSAVNAGVVPCGNLQPAQISHYPPPVSRTPVCAVVSPPGVDFSG
jgi:hypothetical protein